MFCPPVLFHISVYRSSSLLKNIIVYPLVCMYHYLFCNYLIQECLGYFKIFAFTKNSTVYISEHLF